LIGSRFLLASHLRDRGHRHIGYLHEPQRSLSHVSPGMLRRNGTNHALAHRTTAVICHHDVLAAGFLAGLRAAGAEVPTQVAVAGIDDGPLAEGLALTTVRQPFAESGRHAAELLRSLIQSPGHAAARTLLAPQLIVRETT
jgi:LacI family transcriptional regulator